MKRKRSTKFALAAAAGMLAGWVLARPGTAAQTNPHVSTKGGFQAEEVRVGGSCVVVVWGGNVEQFAAVPCRGN